MNKYVLGLALAAAVLIGGAGAAYGRQVSNSIVPTIKVNTTTGTLLTLKTSELSILPQASTTISLNGVSTVEQGPMLASLLTLAGVQYNAACKNDELRWWIEATASNGQAATLTAGEIDPFLTAQIEPTSPPRASFAASAQPCVRRSATSASTVQSLFESLSGIARAAYIASPY